MAHADPGPNGRGWPSSRRCTPATVLACCPRACGHGGPAGQRGGLARDHHRAGGRTCDRGRPDRHATAANWPGCVASSSDAPPSDWTAILTRSSGAGGPRDRAGRRGTGNDADNGRRPVSGRPRSAATLRRHVKSKLSQMPCRVATARTRTPDSCVSATIRSLSSMLHRRRRSRPVMIAQRRPCPHLSRRLNYGHKVASGSRPGGHHRADIYFGTNSHLNRNACARELIWPGRHDATEVCFTTRSHA